MKNRRKRNQKPCGSFYGSHGCAKRADHPTDEHECSCGETWITEQEIKRQPIFTGET